MKTQTGSFLSVMLTTVAFIFLMVYAHPILNIPYTKLKVGSIMSNMKGMTDKKESELMTYFKNQLSGEKITQVDYKNLSIENNSDRIVLKLDYQHCEELINGWYVCADQTISK